MDANWQQAALRELQTWFEVPAIAHYFHIFNLSYDLIEFEIEDLEETLLLDTEDKRCFYPDLLICLLRGWFRVQDGEEVTMDNYDYYLQDLLNFYNGLLQQAECPKFMLKSRYLSPRAKVGILYDMINWRMDLAGAMEQTKDLKAEQMRIQPVGVDNDGFVYWYFYGCRLYKENLVDNYEFPDVFEAEIKNSNNRKRKISYSSNGHNNSSSLDIHGFNNDSASKVSDKLSYNHIDILSQDNNATCNSTVSPSDSVTTSPECQQTNRYPGFGALDGPVIKKGLSRGSAEVNLALQRIESSSSFDESDGEVEKSSLRGNIQMRKRKKRTYALSRSARSLLKKVPDYNSSSSDESDFYNGGRSNFTDYDITCICNQECANVVDVDDDDEVYKWSLSCSTVEEWRNLIGHLKNATTKNEKMLLRNLEELFKKIPDIIKGKEEKQRSKGREVCKS